MRLLAQTIDTLSGPERHRVSHVEIRDALAENYEQAKGPGADRFFQGRVPKALGEMVKTEMLDLNRQGYLLTASGRWSLLKEREGPTPSEREAAAAREEAAAVRAELATITRERDEARRERDVERRERDVARGLVAGPRGWGCLIA
jgi:hypothetical protein